jgi:LPXTG-site transpeptidase (sortase) family protein
MYKVLGRGVGLGFLLVILTVVLLPAALKWSEPRSEVKGSEGARIGFEELLEMEVGEAAEESTRFFSLEIPKIGVEVPVVINVDAANEAEYLEALKQGVAHVKGTYLPGMGGGVTLFAHSIDDRQLAGEYGAVFYRLDELERNDEVQVWYMGEKLTYRVYRAWVTKADDVGVFKRIKNGERLFLVTCTPRETLEKRLIVELLPLTER